MQAIFTAGVNHLSPPFCAKFSCTQSSICFAFHIGHRQMSQFQEDFQCSHNNNIQRTFDIWKPTQWNGTAFLICLLSLWCFVADFNTFWSIWWAAYIFLHSKEILFKIWGNTKFYNKTLFLLDCRHVILGVHGNLPVHENLSLRHNGQMWGGGCCNAMLCTIFFQSFVT